MDYIIKNHKGVYIWLNQNGMPVACTEHEKTLFEYSKARNILDNLPKTLKRLQFKVNPVPDIVDKIEYTNKTMEEKVIQTSSYTISDSLEKMDWEVWYLRWHIKGGRKE